MNTKQSTRMLTHIIGWLIDDLNLLKIHMYVVLGDNFKIQWIGKWKYQNYK